MIAIPIIVGYVAMAGMTSYFAGRLGLFEEDDLVGAAILMILFAPIGLPLLFIAYMAAWGRKANKRDPRQG